MVIIVALLHSDNSSYSTYNTTLPAPPLNRISNSLVRTQANIIMHGYCSSNNTKKFILQQIHDQQQKTTICPLHPPKKGEYENPNRLRNTEYGVRTYTHTYIQHHSTHYIAHTLVSPASYLTYLLTH